MVVDDIHDFSFSHQGNVTVATFDDLSPILSTYQAFDELLFPPTHPGRSPSDTYYLNPTTCLRPHTSAHQHEIIRAGNLTFLCTGDVYVLLSFKSLPIRCLIGRYRRDEIDATHYPVFHQMEGLHIFDEQILNSGNKNSSEQVLFLGFLMSLIY
jgi:phenylalanyl-tRNA synthetase alpha chain